jgi:hypothetical protein
MNHRNKCTFYSSVNYNVPVVNASLEALCVFSCNIHWTFSSSLLCQSRRSLVYDPQTVALPLPVSVGFLICLATSFNRSEYTTSRAVYLINNKLVRREGHGCGLICCTVLEFPWEVLRQISVWIHNIHAEI